MELIIEATGGTAEALALVQVYSIVVCSYQLLSDLFSYQYVYLL